MSFYRKRERGEHVIRQAQHPAAQGRGESMSFGKLNILQHKPWNVWNRDNIEEVSLPRSKIKRLLRGGTRRGLWASLFSGVVIWELKLVRSWRVT